MITRSFSLLSLSSPPSLPFSFRIGRTFSSITRTTPQGTPQNRAFPTNGPQTSTPNKEPSARRCLPLVENSSRQRDVCPASNCGKLRYVGTAPVDLASMVYGEPPPRYGYLENGPESVPMVSGSPRYQVLPADQKRSGYQSVESAFIARTAVVSNVERLGNLVSRKRENLSSFTSGTTVISAAQRG